MSKINFPFFLGLIAISFVLIPLVLGTAQPDSPYKFEFIEGGRWFFNDNEVPDVYTCTYIALNDFTEKHYEEGYSFPLKIILTNPSGDENSFFINPVVYKPEFYLFIVYYDYGSEDGDYTQEFIATYNGEEGIFEDHYLYKFVSLEPDLPDRLPCPGSGKDKGSTPTVGFWIDYDPVKYPDDE